MGYINPLLQLPAARDLLALPAESRRAVASVLRALRMQANAEAEIAWSRRKGPMAAYWRAVATYARHLAHAIDNGRSEPKSGATTFPYPAGKVVAAKLANAPDDSTTTSVPTPERGIDADQT
ncbi:hypothetical protein [Burkholderia cenocepacia]|uniref:hypothetical protein n=1 Tax=Burkholderia cenocepacia TaxID=95486 RepID=UPI00264F33B3|nr:hypothetical protein [Burkholderia cenocepacia]MDN7683070.1 hypothetical protein [Burkholderia cenocepacia]